MNDHEQIQDNQTVNREINPLKKRKIDQNGDIDTKCQQIFNKFTDDLNRLSLQPKQNNYFKPQNPQKYQNVGQIRNSFQPQQNIERKRGFINSRVNKFNFIPADINKNIIRNQPLQNTAKQSNFIKQNDILSKYEQEKQIELNLLNNQQDIDEYIQESQQIEQQEEKPIEQKQINQELKLKPWYQIIQKKGQDNDDQDSSQTEEEAPIFDFGQKIPINQLSIFQQKLEKYRNRVEYVQNSFVQIKNECNLMNQNQVNIQSKIKNLQKIDLQRFFIYLKKLSYKYHELEKQEQIVLKNIALFVLTMNTFQIKIINLKFLDQLCSLILEIEIKDNVEKIENKNLENLVESINMVAFNVIDSQIQSLKQAIYYANQNNKGYISKNDEYIRYMSLFRVDNKSISFFTVILFRILQSLSIILQQQNEDQEENVDAIEVIAKVIQSIAIYIFDYSFKENDSTHQSFLLLQYIYQDFVTLFSQQIDGAPIQYPVFPLFFKAFIIKLLQCVQEFQENITDKRKSQKQQNDEFQDLENDDSQKFSMLQKFELLNILKQTMLASNGLLQRLRKWSKSEQDNCICQNQNNTNKQQSEQYIACSHCKQQYHTICFSIQNKNKYSCFKCFFKNDIASDTLISNRLRIQSQDQFFQIANQFYKDYQSNYYDFSSAHATSLLIQKNYCNFQNISKNKEQKLKDIQDQIKNHLFEIKQENKQRNKENKILTGNYLLVNPILVTLSGRILFAKEELEGLFETMKNLLISLCFSRQAVIRQKTINIFKNLIKADPLHFLQDESILNTIRLSIQDVSSITRESALDIIYQNLEILTEIGVFYQEHLNQNSLIGMIIERSHTDMNIGVRKKIIQILSQILEFNIDQYDENQKSLFMNLKQEIIMILIVRWSDSNGNVRQSLVKSIQKIIKQNKKQQNNTYLNVLFDIVKQWCLFNKCYLPQQMENVIQMEIEDIVQIIWEVLECEKINSNKQENCLIYILSEQIVQSSINKVYNALEDIQQNQLQIQIFSCIRFIQIIGEVYPKAVREQIKSVIDLQKYLQENDQWTSPVHLMFCKIFIDCLQQSETEQNESEEIIDWLTPLQSKQIFEFSLQSVDKEPLVNMQFSIDLLIKICMIRQDVQKIAQILMISYQVITKCSKEQIDLDKNISQISRSIIIVSQLIGRFPEQQKLSKIMNINYEKEVGENLICILNKQGRIKDLLFDITLEGLSTLWLNSDKQLITQDQNHHIFNKVHSRFISNISFNPFTKSMIVQSFINIVQKMNVSQQDTGQQSLQYLTQKMELFVKLMPDNCQCFNSKFRFSLVNLHAQMYLKGMIQPTYLAVQKWIIMQSDFNENILTLSQKQLERISVSRLEIIQQSLFGVKEILEGLYKWQINCGVNSASGFKRIANQQGETIEYNYGILDFTIQIVQKQNKKLVNQILQKWINYGINNWAQQQDDIFDQKQLLKEIKSILFYGEIIFTFMKHVQVQKEQNDHEDLIIQNIENNPILQILQDFCNSNEIQIYKNLKHNKCQQSLFQGLILLINKLCISQLRKQLKSIKSQKKIEDHRVKYCLENKQLIDSLLSILCEQNSQDEEFLDIFGIQVQELLREAIKDKEIKEEKRWVNKLNKNIMIKQGQYSNNKNKGTNKKKRNRNQFINETFDDEQEQSQNEDFIEFNNHDRDDSIKTKEQKSENSDHIQYDKKDVKDRQKTPNTRQSRRENRDYNK